MSLTVEFLFLLRMYLLKVTVVGVMVEMATVAAADAVAEAMLVMATLVETLVPVMVAMAAAIVAQAIVHPHQSLPRLQ